MTADLERELEETTRVLAAARTELEGVMEALLALVQREVTAKRALPACWDALVTEERHQPALEQALAEAREARLAREAASQGTDGGCGDGCGCGD